MAKDPRGESKRPRRIRIARPTVDPRHVPPQGMEPVATGNRWLDMNVNYVNEFESRTRREEALLRAAVGLLRRSRGLKWVGAVVGLIRLVFVGVVVAALAAAFLMPFRADAGEWSFATSIAAMAVAVAVLFGAVRPLGILGFVAAVSTTLREAAPHDRAIAGARALRLLPSLLRLAFAQTLGATGRAYEALMVFVVPVQVAEGSQFAQAQRRSEELVAARWGAGRFRAVGLPRMHLTSALYSLLVRRLGYWAPFAVAPLWILIVGLPIWIFVIFRSVPAALAAAAVYMPMLVWGLAIQPLLDGILRAHLYLYARSGTASPAYTPELLHSCLREEVRASLGMRQRTTGGPVAAGDGRAGVPGVVDRVRAGGADYVEGELGISRADASELVGDLKELWNDERAIMLALRRADGSRATFDQLCQATALPRERCAAAIRALLDGGYATTAVDEAGAEIYAPARKRRFIWEKKG